MNESRAAQATQATIRATDSTRPPHEETFEALYRRLEETVQRLEDGNLPLDEAIDLFEEGMRLAKRCGDHLTTATLRIRQIQTELGLDGLDDA